MSDVIDGKGFTVAVVDERPDEPNDPTVLVFIGGAEAPVLTYHIPVGDQSAGRPNTLAEGDLPEADRLAALACGEPDGKPCTVPDCPWCHANPTIPLADALEEASWAIATGASRARALALIFAERTSQDAKWGSQRQHPDKMWLTILLEEVGEIARAILEGTPVKPELVQVAAVALCWLEALEK